MNDLKGAYETVCLAWHMYWPQYELPEQRFIRRWVRDHSVSTVLSCLEFMTQDEQRFYSNGQHLGRLITNALKTVTFAA